MKNILIFNDISGLGNCSLSTNLPILSKLGHYCMPVVTACYSCQTGFDNYAVLPNDKVVDFACRISANAAPNATYVGFCNDTATLDGILEVVSDVLPSHAYLLVDPIMGDNGKLYPVFNDEYVESIKRIVTLADCITPNLTEACLLCGVDYFELTSHKDEVDYIDRCESAFCNLLNTTKAKSAIVTGISQTDIISNLVFDENGVEVVTTNRVNVDFSGTGDVFSTVILGKLLNGSSLLEACQVAADFVALSARNTDRTDRRFGVDFCKVLDTLN